jgi:hypothetical protein
MRCFVGVTLFLVLYFGSCQVLGAAAGPKAVAKWHALAAVGAGAVAIVGCCIPTLLVKINERNQRRRYTEDEVHG